MTAPWAGTATSIGSLPHDDAVAATDFILRTQPGLPAAPQLPRHAAREGMIAQALAGVVGVSVAEDGTIRVIPRELDPEAPVDADFNDAYWSGYQEFFRQVKGSDGPYKFQLTGPLTLTLALMAHDVPEQLAFAVSGEAVKARAHALRELLDRQLPGAALMVFVDEPALVTTAPEAMPIERRAAIDTLTDVLRHFGPGIATGVHCCGTADWRYVLPAKPDVVSFPVGGELAANAWPLREHLRNGGCIAWGVVPTTAPYQLDVDVLWRRLEDDWHVLEEGGCEPSMLRRQALMTPECGLAGLTIEEASAVLDVTNQLARRLSLAARLA